MSLEDDEEEIISVEHLEKATVARCLEPEVTMFSLPEIRQTLLEEAESKPALFVLDFSETSYIDSSGIAVIFKVRHEVHNYGGIFCVTGLKPGLRKVLGAVVREDEILFYETVEEALAENG
ncbi:MAG: STAS domain-containing protein [Spirochaetales bacterium]|nr:STAS domain-containing protein [Leptospiraceae bacterium]MCP5482992.1 STAS domain-containing protein [Spirochaetales bacterium]MCP5484829.1 STAS domain-containing protein [Spirochaetales bacterium]